MRFGRYLRTLFRLTVRRGESLVSFYLQSFVVAPIVREPSGLARSSRNAYLSGQERANALALSQALAALKEGPWAAQRRRTECLLSAHGLKVDYVEAVDAGTLLPVKAIRKGVAVLLAAYSGGTRLIDNRLW